MRQVAPNGLRFTGRGVKRVKFLDGIPQSNITPCFHGVLDKASIVAGQANDSWCCADRCLCRCGVPNLKLETAIARRLRPQLMRTRFCSFAYIHERGEGFIVDDDRFGAIERLFACFCNDHSDRLTQVLHEISC